MTSGAIKRIQAAGAQVLLGQVVQEVAATDTPVIIQTQGEDRAVIVSLRDFKRRWPVEESHHAPEREQVRAALQAAGLSSQPTPQEVAEVQAFEASHPPEDQEHILAEWRQLNIVPSLRDHSSQP